MNSYTLRLAAGLATTQRPEDALTLLAAAPLIAPTELMEVARSGERYGLTPEQAESLRSMHVWLAKALRALTGELDRSVPARVYGIFAMVSREQNKLDQARRFYRFAFESATEPWEKVSAIGGIALLEREAGNADRARALFRQAVELSQSGGVSGESLGYLYNNWGVLEMDREEFATAEKLFEASSSIGTKENLTDVYLTARLNQAEAAYRQRKPEEVSKILDEIQWIENSASPRKASYEELRQKVTGGPRKVKADPRTQSIAELEQLLRDFPDNEDRNLILRILGARYEELREAPRADNLRMAAVYWEEAVGELEAESTDAARPAVLALHTALGNLYNELMPLSFGVDLPQKARQHFERALALLPNDASFLEQRQILLHDLANATAHVAHTKGGIGQVDREMLLQSVDLQAELLQTMQDPKSRCFTLLNMQQTYRELSDPPDASVHEYRTRAWECAVAAETALRAIKAVDAPLSLRVALGKGRAAFEMGRPRSELEGLRVALDTLLQPERRKDIDPRTLSEAFHVSAGLARSLRERARFYRRSLQAERPIRGIATGESIAHHRVVMELITSLIEWGDLERALWFSMLDAGITDEQHSRRFRKRLWRPPNGSAVVLFQFLSWERLVAIVVTAAGPQVRDLPMSYVQLMGTAMRFLNLRAGAKSIEESKSNFDLVTAYIGDKLFRPLEDLLPQGGRLAISPTFPMSKLPLHAAVLSDSKRLLERFDVLRVDGFSFEKEDINAGETRRDELFVGTYSPPEARLPFAAAEARAVSNCYGSATGIQIREDATPEAVLQGMERAHIVHLCCHGVFDWDSPLESKLFFARRPLTLREVALSLARSPCDLIVLSACEVGSYLEAGREEADFVTTLLRAGCRAVVSADWGVDDLSTAVLMEKLHREIADGADPARALAIAQRGIQTEAAGSIASRIADWLASAATDLAPAEQQYLMGKVALLRRHANEVPFGHPIFWGYFSLRTRGFRMTSQLTTGSARLAKGKSAP